MGFWWMCCWRSWGIFWTLNSFVQNIGMELYDQDDSLLFRSNVDVLGLEAINKTLDPGIYYLRVFPVGSNRTKYNLSINIVER